MWKTALKKFVLKAVFQTFYLVHSWIRCPICCSQWVNFHKFLLSLWLHFSLLQLVLNERLCKMYHIVEVSLGHVCYKTCSREGLIIEIQTLARNRHIGDWTYRRLWTFRETLARTDLFQLSKYWFFCNQKFLTKLNLFWTNVSLLEPLKTSETSGMEVEHWFKMG